MQARLPKHQAWSSVSPVRVIAALLIAIVVPLNLGAACTMANPVAAAHCANCPMSAPGNRVNCCHAPTVPDLATGQAQSTQHLDTVATLPVMAALSVASRPHIRAIADGFSPPDRLASLAILCSRQI